MKNNIKNDLKEIEELERIFLGECNDRDILKLVVKKAKEIAERNIFKDGCGKIIKVRNGYLTSYCGSETYLCPDCERKRKIQKIYGEIDHSQNGYFA